MLNAFQYPCPLREWFGASSGRHRVPESSKEIVPQSFENGCGTFWFGRLVSAGCLQMFVLDLYLLNDLSGQFVRTAFGVRFAVYADDGFGVALA